MEGMETIMLSHDSVQGKKGDMNLPISVWLDGIKAVPTIGILTSQSFETASAVLTRLKPLLSRWQQDHGQLEVEFDDATVLKIQRSDGLFLTMSSTNMLLGWRYVTETRDKGGSHLPELEIKTTIRPFQDLLADLLVILKEALLELYRDGPRQLRRVGIVAEGGMDRDAMPPGIQSYVDFLASIWGAKTVDLHGYVTAVIAETDEHVDRCHHFINKVASEVDMVPIKLDWQRTFSEPRSPSANKLIDEVRACSSTASSYFDKFGLGDLNYDR